MDLHIYLGYRARLRADEAFTYIRDLLGGLKSGTCYIQAGDDSIELTPADQTWPRRLDDILSAELAHGPATGR